MPDAKRPLKVFLSYASQDKSVVRELSGRLAGEGWIDPWVDAKKLLPGQDWRTKIEEAVETSDIVIVVLSNNSVTKDGYVQKELRFAQEIALEKPEDAIFLIPLRLDDCNVPRGLRFYQWVDYFGDKKEESYNALNDSFKLRYQQVLNSEEERAQKEKEKQEREFAEILVREKIEREAIEKLAREKAEREAAEKVAREKAERETAIQVAREREQKAIKEKLARDAVEKTEREKAERQAAERIKREKAKREAAEKAKQEKLESQSARKATLARIVLDFSVMLKTTIAKSKLIFRFTGLIGIVIVLFWMGSWTIPRLLSLMPTETPHSTITPTVIPSQTLGPNLFLTKLSAPTITKTKTPTKVPIHTLVSLSTSTSIPIPKINANIKPDRPDFPIGVLLTFRSEKSTITTPDGTTTFCDVAKTCTYEWTLTALSLINKSTNKIYTFAFNKPGTYNLFLKVCYYDTTDCDTDTLSIEIKR